MSLGAFHNNPPGASVDARKHAVQVDGSVGLHERWGMILLLVCYSIPESVSETTLTGYIRSMISTLARES